MKTKQARNLADILEKYLLNGRYSPYKSEEVRQAYKALAVQHVMAGTATIKERAMTKPANLGQWNRKYLRNKENQKRAFDKLLDNIFYDKRPIN